MPKKPTGLLSFGVFVIIIAIGLLAYVTQLIGLDDVLSLIIALSGVWVIVLAGIRMQSPEKYERGAFSTLVWGILLIAVGGAWFLLKFDLLYSIIFFLAVIGILALASAFRAWQK